jgi:hypothetical protein
VGAVPAEDRTKPPAILERPPMDPEWAIEMAKAKGMRFLTVADPLLN